MQRLACLALFSATSLLFAAEPTPRLAVINTLRVGGDGGWDYVNLDSESGRIYVPRATRVMVLDLEGHLKGEIPGTAGVHGVAYSRELDRGWTSNGKAGTVTVFKASTLAVEKVVKTTGDNPDAILFEPVTKRVFSFNGGGKNATVISAETSEVLGTIPVNGRPEFAVQDGKGRVYVNVEDTAEILAINARTLKVEARWSIKPLDEPTGLAIDLAHNRLFSVAKNKLMAVVDAGTGKLVTTVPIGAGADAVAHDPANGVTYVSNGEGTLTLIQSKGADAYVTSTVATRPGAKTLALDAKSHRIYLPTADFAPGAEAKAKNMLPGSFQLLVVGEAN